MTFSHTGIPVGPMRSFLTASTDEPMTLVIGPPRPTSTPTSSSPGTELNGTELGDGTVRRDSGCNQLPVARLNKEAAVSLFRRGDLERNACTLASVEGNGLRIGLHERRAFAGADRFTIPSTDERSLITRKLYRECFAIRRERHDSQCPCATAMLEP
jgi:hypothetical protein